MSLTNTPRQSEPRPPGRRQMLLLTALAILMVLVPYLVWHATWFGRPLTNQKLEEFLGDEQHPRKIQNALSQISDRIVQDDTAVHRWYPRVVALAEHPNPKIRITAAWVMGQDNRSEPFHQALLGRLADPDVMVRRNAALSLVRFGDAAGRREIVKMLEPYEVLAPAPGTVSLTLRTGQEVAAGTLLARFEAGQGPVIEIRSPFSGWIESLIPQPGEQVPAGGPIVALAADSSQVWEALRGLYLVGQPADLPLIERFGRGVPHMRDEVRQQALLTARAIRNRSKQESIR